MSEVLDRARAHLVKSKEFLDEATGALERGALNVATSNAALAGVNCRNSRIFALYPVLSPQCVQPLLS